MVVTSYAAKHGGAGVKPEGDSRDIEIEDTKRNVKDFNYRHCDSNNSISSLIYFSFLLFFCECGFKRSVLDQAN